MVSHASDLEMAARPAKLKDSGGRTPSNAMTASVSSWRRSFNGSRKTRPPTAAKGSTISASGGQGRGVVEVATDLPPIKRSTSRVSFPVKGMRRTCHEAEAIH